MLRGLTLATAHHLAQLNIARMRASLADPVMAGFVAQIDQMNAAAKAADGFIWRLVSDDTEAASFSVFGQRNRLLNVSVWASIGAFTFAKPFPPPGTLRPPAPSGDQR